MKPKIVDFLRDIAQKIENDTVDEKTLALTSEYFMKTNFVYTAIPDDEDVLKYLSLGWYIYTQLPKNEIMNLE